MITFRHLGQRGRLGNQLFQIAATIGIARDHGEKPIFPEDWLYRHFFSLPDAMFGPIPSDAKEAPEFVHHLDSRCRDYLQDINLFLPHLAEIRPYLQPSIHARRSITPIGLIDTLGVHVRRGDNVVDPGVPNKADYHPVPPLEYYQRGMDHFSYAPYTVVVSDDIPWCKKNIPADRYSRGTPYLKEHEHGYGIVSPLDWIDFFYLAQCDHFVVTGSTFGIWAALISGVAPDHVVRPNKVYGPLLDYINDDTLFHPDWKILPCF